MKNSGNISLIISICICAFILVDKFNKKETGKIGVVHMEKLVYEFKGMKEASEKYSLKVKKWNLEADSLENKLKELYQQIKIDSLKKQNEKLKNDLKMFSLFRQSYVEYRQNIEENAENEDRQMTIGVMNQVNEYIKTYAKNEGFDVILCNNQNQSVGFAKDQIDVTKEVLEFANNQYNGVK